MQLAQRLIAQVVAPCRRPNPFQPVRHTLQQDVVHYGQRHVLHLLRSDDEGRPAARVLIVLHQSCSQVSSQCTRLICRESRFLLGGSEGRVLVGHLIPEGVVLVLQGTVRALDRYVLANTKRWAPSFVSRARNITSGVLSVCRSEPRRSLSTGVRERKILRASS